MIEVIGVRFNKEGKIYYFDPDNLHIQLHDDVSVETVRGIEYGKVVLVNKLVDIEDVVLPLKKVMRIANEKDSQNVKENRKLAQEALDICFEKIAHHGLE